MNYLEYEGKQYWYYPHTLKWDKYYPQRMHYECITRFPVPLNPLIEQLANEPNIIVRLMAGYSDDVPPQYFKLKTEGVFSVAIEGNVLMLMEDKEHLPTLINFIDLKDICDLRQMKLKILTQ